MAPHSISVLQHACKTTSQLHHLKCGHYVDLRVARFPCQRNCMDAPQPSPVAEVKGPALFRGQCWFICGQCLLDEWSENEAHEMQEIFDLLWQTDEYMTADVVEQANMNQQCFDYFEVPGQFQGWVKQLEQQGRLEWGMETDAVDEDEFVDDMVAAFEVGAQLADTAGGPSQAVQQEQGHLLRTLKSQMLVLSLEPFWQSKMHEELACMTLDGPRKQEQNPAPHVPAAFQPRPGIYRNMEDGTEVETDVEMEL